MPWWCPKQKVHGIFDALQMLGSHRLNRGSHSRFSWCKGARLGWFKKKGFGRARKIHDQAMSHVAKSSTIEIIQKPSKPVAVCHDEFICHGSSAVWLRCDWATPPFTRSQESTSGQPGRIQWFMKMKKERRSKHEKWKESSNISWTVDRIEKHWSTGKKTCFFKQLGIGWCEDERVRDPKKITPIATAWAHYGETQRGNTMTTATEKICKLDMKEKLNQLEMWYK